METIQHLADQIDELLAEMDSLLTASIYISENAEDQQHELLRHTTVSLAYITQDKIKAANRRVTRILAAARNA
ncbi:hypothetical protein [Mesorhizobium sp. M8A.F.Ca.ET.021.01.1.1]|uniref:hypothetical protein n=1 Tax=Mesorhizobium sp. M8A.F.Ca.ET.021.01.1.1 TaxID=2496757 RepID=UPI000FCC3BDA|nr:hypothetical protein [Mesorhizobium sp. M8A.F.Ca.ET.021.01.1.1]RUW50982.1 hypothetical protein EOA36_15475 [Mesorhizobium sp. M8A.F.Ca.ET.021.01.1.1]